MNPPLPFVSRGAKAWGIACRHLIIHFFVNVGSPTTLSSPRVRWYLRFKLSYRDLAELAREFGVSVAPSTILR